MKQAPCPRSFVKAFLSSAVAFSMLIGAGCKQDDPKPVNEEEVITTVEVFLTPQGGGNSVTLRFFDEDGELGSIAPIITASGSLKPSTLYTAEIRLRNETISPPIDVALEVAEEAEDHLFCFLAADIVITYDDEDANGLPVGLKTLWETAEAGERKVTVSLRHQAGTKDGKCPGSGETDVEVTFDVTIG